MSKLNRGSALAAGLAAVFVFAGHAQAKPIAYPAKGQSAQQQQKDDGACYSWAKTNTGVDPAAVAAAPPPPPPGPTGDRAKGAVRGAVIGGAIDGNDGAKTGAAVGVVAGGAKSRHKQQAQQQSAQAQKQGSMDTFNRAYAACMEGKGYTIK